MIELLELKFSRRWQTNKIESDWSNSQVTHLRANSVHLAAFLEKAPSSPCNQPHRLAISLTALLTAPSPCNQPHRLATTLTALLTTPSPSNQPRRLAISLVALQSTSSPCCWPHHLAVVNIVPNNAPYSAPCCAAGGKFWPKFWASSNRKFPFDVSHCLVWMTWVVTFPHGTSFSFWLA